MQTAEALERVCYMYNEFRDCIFRCIYICIPPYFHPCILAYAHVFNYKLFFIHSFAHSFIASCRLFIAKVAYEFACDNYSEKVIYFEVRFAPQLHASAELDIEAVIIAVNNVCICLHASSA